MKPVPPEPVKLFFGILYSDRSRLESAMTLLEERYGSRDYQSAAFPFRETDYYADEMGKPIFRVFISFTRLISPGDLAEIKIEANQIENSVSVRGSRKVNLDPGYMDYDKVVLASAKYNGQKIYLDLGIWADLTLHYEKGAFHPYPWSFPDFKQGIYDQVFLDIRMLFKKQRRQQAG
jgi:hypothetical protein